MKRILPIVLLLCLIIASTQAFSQDIPDNFTKNINQSTLSYHKEVPDAETYDITKNLNSIEIPVSTLEKINSLRRKDEDFLWVVNDDIEILIYSISNIDRNKQNKVKH